MKKHSSARHPTAQGFSLIELMVVIAILGISAALAGPPLTQWMQANRVISGANNLLADIQYARSEAIRNNRDVHLAPAVNNYADGWNIFTVTSSGARDALLKVNRGLPRQNRSMTSNISALPIIFRGDGSMYNTGGVATVTLTVGDVDSSRGCTGVPGKPSCAVREVNVSPTGRATRTNPNELLGGIP
jgi:type IV fimbrial biogenesis protein FimT